MSARLLLREFLKDPVTIGAIAPSGRDLAEKMVTSANIQPGHVIAELGAGTGPMTAELVSRYPQNPLVVLEPKAELAATLRDRFSTAYVVEEFAQDLKQITESWGHTPIDRVVSSLPWAIWPLPMQTEILEGILAAMAPEGRLVTFTYWHAQPLPAARRFRSFLHKHFSSVERSAVAWKNLPPAFVFICDR